MRPFDPGFLDELRARNPIAGVIGRRTRLAKSGRNWKACCPFHGEKTPSFYVYDDHFHCFGCGVHGDVISFVMQSGGQSFPDAVASLAAEAGLEMPKQDARGEAEQARARSLTEALQAAQALFVRTLASPEGRSARDYLAGRGLSAATIEAFGLGWSGDGRGALAAELARQGIDAALMGEAGLMRLDEAGKPKGEMFFHRVTFPIRDRRGGLVSFGGRTLGDGQPKYLNGPETRLFSKRMHLFGLDRALAARKHATTTARPGGEVLLIVVEGYMDVIALHEAGFAGAVAPLGTALTAEQLEALWRVAPAPVLCFDADAAGRRATLRAAETALPMLSPERSLRFCRLPDGEDPDSLLRKSGPGRLRQAIEAAQPLGEVLFGLLSDGSALEAPEQRASLRARLIEAAGRIGDRGLAGEYRRLLLDRFYETTRRQTQGQTQGKAARSGGRAPGRSARGFGRVAGSGADARAAAAARAGVAPDVQAERLRILTAILLRHPELLRDVEEAFCSLALPEGLQQLRGHMVDWAAESQRVTVASGGAEVNQALKAAPALLDSQDLMDHLRLAGLSSDVEAVLTAGPLPLLEQVAPGDMPAELEKRWWHFFGLLNYERLTEERQASLRDWIERNDAPSERRLRALSEACAALRGGEQADEDDWG